MRRVVMARRGARCQRVYERGSPVASMTREIALVTGASSGIGAALARRLARDGMHVGLVARRADRLEALATELRAAHHIEADVLTCDLARPGSVAGLVDELGRRELQVDWLINNAGYGTLGAFHTLPIDGELDEIALNVEALVELTGRLLPAMVQRGRGVVMNVASIGAYLPTPGMATYTATKAFVLSFSEALAVELPDTGVRVLCVCPGVTRTEFQARAKVDVSYVPALLQQTADEVADESVRAVGRSAVVVNGVINRVTLGALKFVPHRLLTRVAAALIRPEKG